MEYRSDEHFSSPRHDGSPNSTLKAWVINVHASIPTCRHGRVQEKKKEKVEKYMYCTKTWQGRFKDCGTPHDQQKWYQLYSRRIGSCGKTVLEKELKKLDIKKEVPVVAEYN